MYIKENKIFFFFLQARNEQKTSLDIETVRIVQSVKIYIGAIFEKKTTTF